MPDSLEPTIHTADALRAKRLAQIANVVIAALCVLLPFFWMQMRWTVVVPLVGGVAMMLLCQVLGRRGWVDAANMMLLVSVTALASILMWVGEGLRDAALLAYPVILIMAGLLVGKKGFYCLWAGILVFVAFLTVATEVLDWRTSIKPTDPIEFWRDVSVILVASGLAVWIIVNDMHQALASLRAQILQVTASQNQLTYLSQHDALTGLPNRSMGREHIQQAIVHATRNGSRVALLFVDLDNFKAVNDALGHAAGDEFLKQVASRLSSAVRKSDIVDRHGGDEFVIGLTDIDKAEDVSHAANKLMGSLSSPIVLRDTQISTSCSIGIAMFPDDGPDYESLLRQADIAMYQAKQSGRNAYRFFDQTMHTNIQNNVMLLSNLRLALEREELALYYQPVFDLATGALVGAEALIRWIHPEKGLIAPGEFIPAAEKSGLIVDIGAWVLREACRQMAAWHAQGRRNFVLAVNLSPVQFRRGNVELVIENALKQSGLDPACLELEITESTLVQDTESFIVSLRRLKALGVKISIDDFGTGYSNLSYLQRFSVDTLKIDQSFVKRLLAGPQDRAIVTAIIQMAKSLDLSTTAEGIEDDASRQILIGLGCSHGQGYFFARPMPASEFDKAAVHWH